MSQSFTLQPFAPVDCNWAITGSLAYQGAQLSLNYCVTGDLDQLLIPAPSQIPTRQFALWEATCLEFFLAPVGHSDYWEFNMSPSGNWQVFKLDSYRQGLRDEIAFTALPFVVQVKNSVMMLDVSIDLSQILPPHTAWEISVTAVLQDIDGDFSYWAIDHSGSEADFHLRESFRLASDRL
jgi:hypothetical protein